MSRCAKCETPLPPGAATVGAAVHGMGSGAGAYAGEFPVQACPACHRPCVAHQFPASLAAGGEIAKPWPVNAAGMPGAAPCFYHESKRALVACDGCGRYLCTDCKADWLGKTLCLGCIHTQREIKGSGEFQSRVTLYDNIALALVVFPFATLVYGVFLVMFTAPVALFLVIRNRNRSRGIVPRGATRAVLAGTLSVLCIAGWIAVIVGAFFV